MDVNHIILGIVVLTATLGTLGWRYSTLKKAPLPVWGWVGLAIILLAELLLFLHIRWVEVFFTPIVWTGYLFGAVWVGFILLLDPINHFWGGRSLLRDLEQGDSSRLTAFLCSGLVCGILWEFWNYWAGAKWLYVFPVWQNWKVFEMPVPGYLGFPPFAVECLVMYEFLGCCSRWASSGRIPPCTLFFGVFQWFFSLFWTV